jgi:hypothetical protein|tara:strand:+ start:173 stop:529 length:357 start_codon:yes stop_codon:yes gene_type:complete
MIIDISMNYLSKLPYEDCNFENVKIHYGKLKAVALKSNASAFVTSGKITIFTIEPPEGEKRNEIELSSPSAEIKNSTAKTIFFVLDDSFLIPEKDTDIVFEVIKGIKPCQENNYKKIT